MSYISLNFAILVAAALIAYYLMPRKYRWTILLTASLIFYALAGKWALILVVATASVAYVFSRLISSRPSKKALAIIGNLLVLAPWIVIKLSGISVFSGLLGREPAIVGISFYTLELVAYITDVYVGRTEAERNYLHFVTFALFFPKIMQGPICRYREMAPKLVEGHEFDSKTFTMGIMEVMWGAFLKFMIADKCNLIVNPVFSNFRVYDGLNLMLALALFLVVLYTDFLACVMICRGISEMFGIDLFMNFRRPLLATNFKEFWQRWHISLSKWLADYIYIPLGGSRKGEKRRLVNLLITFAVSGLWHGTCTGFLMWGFLQAVYRMGEEIVAKLTDRKPQPAPGSRELGEPKLEASKSAFPKSAHPKSGAAIWLGRFKICFLYGFSLVFFKLPSAREGFAYIRLMFNFTGLDNLKAIGLINKTMGYKEFIILLGAILLLLIKELANEANVNIKEKILGLPFALRLVFYVVFVMIIVSFGTYGYGFNSADFIYGGF